MAFSIIICSEYNFFPKKVLTFSAFCDIIILFIVANLS